jgi:hypothetical protein
MGRSVITVDIIDDWQFPVFSGDDKMLIVRCDNNIFRNLKINQQLVRVCVCVCFDWPQPSANRNKATHTPLSTVVIIYHIVLITISRHSIHETYLNTSCGLRVVTFSNMQHSHTYNTLCNTTWYSILV